MWPFRKREIEQETLEPVNELQDSGAELLESIREDSVVTKEQALEIPSVSSCIEKIADAVASCPIKLYKEENGQITEVENDLRCYLLNDDTRDTLNANQFWHSIIEDLLLDGNAYAYLNKHLNDIKSIHYVDSDVVSINRNYDPIFKDYNIIVNGKSYYPFQFLKFIKNTKNGSSGKGVLEKNQEILSLAYHSLKYERNLINTGGNKRGFLKSAKKLSKEAISKLKAAWKRLYSNNEENMMVLNDGIDFQEASNTSVEMQLNENKESNSKEVCKLFHVPPSLLSGTQTEEEYTSFIKLAVIPNLDLILCALNRDLLLESERDFLFFAFDTKELLKGDIEKRYKAYESAIKSHWMQPDEVRYMENMAPLGLNFIQLGLDSVLYDPIKKTVYTPNTDKTTNLKGGEIDENRN